MKEFLIDQGSEGIKVEAVKEKKELTPKRLKDLLELLLRLEKLSSATERRGVKFGKYLQLGNTKTKKLPLYRVKVDGEIIYLYSDEELAKIKAKSGAEEKELEMEGEEGGGEEEKPEAIAVQEFYEAREIEKIAKEIAKFDLDIADYEKEKPEKEAYEAEKPAKKKKAPEEKPQFIINGEKEIRSLKDLLDHILTEGEKGMTIQRYKGLGEMNPEQLWETTMDPERRTLQQVTIEDAVKADEMFTILMGDDVDLRREFIIAHAREVKNLDI